MPGSTYSQDTLAMEKAKATKTSKVLFNSCVAGFIGGVLLLMAFCSPYWLQSWDDTASPFVSMGIWEACFYRFRYPRNQIDKLFTGCNPIWGTEYRELREWLLQPWLMLVQFLMCVSFIFSFLSQIFDVGLLLRMPLERILRSWLLYPNYNYVSWSYAAACFSMIAHGVAGWYMYLEARDATERRDRNMALVMQMYPTPGLEGSLSQWTAHGSQFI